MGQNGVGTFILGVVAAVVLFLLWKKERGPDGGLYTPGLPGATLTPAAPSGSSCAGGGCAGCGTGGSCGASPAAAASPVFQNAMTDLGLAGQISPGTPPLGGVDTSFYGTTGPSSDQSFTFVPASASSANTPGSPTTPAAVTPVRSTAPVASYADNGFVSRYNISGVFGSARRTAYLQ